MFITAPRCTVGAVIMSNLLQGVCVCDCVCRGFASPECEHSSQFHPGSSVSTRHNDNLNLVTVSVNVTFEKRQNY